ncbi:MAG TPA: outer membrane beta-barrel protein, partial [Gammaproteobacteria bacterium]|nr:outer membrane beta-barrel protein [Gammaproteobacteria bacterium]
TAKDGNFGGRVYVGYQYNQYLAAEIGATYYGEADVTVNGTKVEPETYGGDVVGKMFVPVFGPFSLFGKAGLGYLHVNDAANYDTSSSVSRTENRINFIYGLGAEYSINANLYLDAGWSRNLGRSDIGAKYLPDADLYTVGLGYKIPV